MDSKSAEENGVNYENKGQRIDYYCGGDMCQVSGDDVGGQLTYKSTKVVHEDQCCWQLSDFDGSLQSQNQEHKSQLRIMDVEEQSECAHVVRLCSICLAPESDEGTSRIVNFDWTINPSKNAILLNSGFFISRLTDIISSVI